MTAPLQLLLQTPLPGEPPPAVGSSLHWIDLVGLALIGLFGLLGAYRGLWWQVIRLLGLAAAALVARAFAPRLGSRFEVASGLPGPVAQGVVWLLVFLAVLLAASLLGSLGKRTLDAMQLGLVDRFGGAVAGVLTAILLHAAFLVGLTYLAPPYWAEASLRHAGSRRLLEAVTTRIHLLVDAEQAERLRPWIDGGPPPRVDPTAPGPQREPVPFRDPDPDRPRVQ